MAPVTVVDVGPDRSYVITLPRVPAHIRSVNIRVDFDGLHADGGGHHGHHLSPSMAASMAAEDGYKTPVNRKRRNDDDDDLPMPPPVVRRPMGIHRPVMDAATLAATARILHINDEDAANMAAAARVLHIDEDGHGGRDNNVRSGAGGGSASVTSDGSKKRGPSKGYKWSPETKARAALKRAVTLAAKASSVGPSDGAGGAGVPPAKKPRTKHVVKERDTDDESTDSDSESTDSDSEDSTDRDGYWDNHARPKSDTH